MFSLPGYRIWLLRDGQQISPGTQLSILSAGRVGHFHISWVGIFSGSMLQKFPRDRIGSICRQYFLCSFLGTSNEGCSDGNYAFFGSLLSSYVSRWEHYSLKQTGFFLHWYCEWAIMTGVFLYATDCTWVVRPLCDL